MFTSSNRILNTSIRPNRNYMPRLHLIHSV